MNFEEFLLSNEIGHQFEKSYILKLKFDENIDFIYRPDYGEFEYNYNLEFLGLFDKKHKELYGTSYYFNFENDLKNSYFKGGIDVLKDKLYEDASNILNNYIKENKESLKKMAKPIFDKYILIEQNSTSLKNQAIQDYIYQNEYEELKFSINDYESERSTKDLIISYIKNPKETAKKIYDNYINRKDEIRYSSYSSNDPNFMITEKERIGARILENEFKHNILEEIKANPNNEYKKKYDIVNSIKDLDAQMITLTLKHNGKTITFKYPKEQLYRFYITSWHIPDVKTREAVEELYKDKRFYDDYIVDDIVSIQYSRKILYEDKNLLNNDIEETKENSIPDIVDEMLD